MSPGPLLVVVFLVLAGSLIGKCANQTEEIQAHCIFGQKGVQPGKIVGLIELFQEVGASAARGVQVIGELALTEAEKRKEEGKKRYRLFVHVNGSLERACADAGEVLDWAGMSPAKGSKLGELGTFTTDDIALFDFQSQRLGLSGPHSIIGRSLVIHGADGSAAACCRIVEGPVRLGVLKKKCCWGDNRECCPPTPVGQRAAKEVTPFRTVDQRGGVFAMATTTTMTAEASATATNALAGPQATPVQMPGGVYEGGQMPSSAPATLPPHLSPPSPEMATSGNTGDPLLKEFKWVEKEPNEFVGVYQDPATAAQKDLDKLQWVQTDENTFEAVVPAVADGKGPPPRLNKCHHCGHHHLSSKAPIPKATATWMRRETTTTTTLLPTPIRFAPPQWADSPPAPTTDEKPSTFSSVTSTAPTKLSPTPVYFTEPRWVYPLKRTITSSTTMPTTTTTTTSPRWTEPPKEAQLPHHHQLPAPETMVVSSTFSREEERKKEHQHTSYQQIVAHPQQPHRAYHKPEGQLQPVLNYGSKKHLKQEEDCEEDEGGPEPIRAPTAPGWKAAPSPDDHHPRVGAGARMAGAEGKPQDYYYYYEYY